MTLPRKSGPILVHTPEVAAALPELAQLQAILQQAPAGLRVHQLLELTCCGHRLPVPLIEFGSTSPSAPVVAYVGGVHGVERIGTQVLIAFLHSLMARMPWDRALRALLSEIRVIFIPLLNPTGMWHRTRANTHGVDLMRNAPVQAEESPPLLLGGQRISRHLPWYRGQPQRMEAEALALCNAVRQRLHRAPFSISLDCHSGFGKQDRIWFPYARTRRPIDDLGAVYALRGLFRTAYPNHAFYRIEPQSHSYTTHGDLWDLLYDEARQHPTGGTFLPLTLELGSWLWVRKNPSQLFSRLGIFNPVRPHRHRRILRQHLLWLEFLMHAAASWQDWLPREDRAATARQDALAYWGYPE